jgi:EAL domain-containing protein (putative c-di-GMP-specific phosphodiesterase class I)
VHLASILGIGVIAEGAETEAHLSHLRTLHCQYVQGFVFAKPLDSNSAETWLDSYRAQMNKGLERAIER